MLTKQKKSFLERLSGTKEEEINNSGEPPLINPLASSKRDNTGERLFSSVVGNAKSQTKTWLTEAESTEGQLTVDVYQTPDAIVVCSIIGGVAPEDVDVSINNDMVVIKGTRKNPVNIDPKDYYYQECFWGTFSRSIILPVEVAADKSEASIKNGILTIRLFKAEKIKTKKIPIKSL